MIIDYDFDMGYSTVFPTFIMRVRKDSRMNECPPA